MTAIELTLALTSLMAERPEACDWPVHLLDMADEKHEGDGILTIVEVDSFEPNELRMVVSLIADAGRLTDKTKHWTGDLFVEQHPFVQMSGEMAGAVCSERRRDAKGRYEGFCNLPADHFIHQDPTSMVAT